MARDNPPAFEQTELSQSPFLDRRHGLDRGRFRAVLDDFYALQGWDLERGWPTRERLRQLGLEDLYEPMVTGAEEATVTGHHLEPSATDGRALIQDFWAIDRHA